MIWLCTEANHNHLATTPEDHDALDQLIRTTADAKQRDRYRAIRLAIDGEQTTGIQHALRAITRLRAAIWCYTYRDHSLDATAASQADRPTMLPPEHHEAFRQRVLDRPTEDDAVVDDAVVVATLTGAGADGSRVDVDASAQPEQPCVRG